MLAPRRGHWMRPGDDRAESTEGKVIIPVTELKNRDFAIYLTAHKV